MIIAVLNGKEIARILPYVEGRWPHLSTCHTDQGECTSNWSSHFRYLGMDSNVQFVFVP